MLEEGVEGVNDDGEQHGRDRITLAQSTAVPNRWSGVAVEENLGAGRRQEKGDPIKEAVAEAMASQHLEQERPRKFQPLSGTWRSSKVMNNARKYDPLDPIECLELHLKKVVLKNYDGLCGSSINFAKFFVLNAKGLKEMKITLPYHRPHGWFANHSSLLRVRIRASPDARIEMRCGTKDDFTHNKHTHDLSMAEPFHMPSSGCCDYTCS